MPPRYVSLAIFVVIAVIHLSYIALGIAPLHWNDSSIFDAMAWNVVQGDGLSVTSGIPSAEREPGYSLFILAPLYAMFGHSIIGPQIVQALLAAVTCVGIYWIGRKFLSNQSGIIAAFSFGMFPAVIVYSGEIMTETLYAALLVLCIFLFLLALDKKTVRWFIVSGMAIGLLALTRSAALFLPLLMVGIIWLVERRTRSIKTIFVHSSVFIIVFAAVVSPWFIRNAIQFDEFVLGRQGGGAIYWTGSYVPWDGDWQGHIWPLSEVKDKSLTVDEQEALLREMTLQNIKEDPLAVAVVYAKKPLKILFQPEGMQTLLIMGALQSNVIASIALVLAFTVQVIILSLALLGVFQFKKFSIFYTVFSVIFLYHIVIYMPLNAVPRYGIPLYPLLLLSAGLTISTYLQKCKQRSDVCMVSYHGYGLYNSNAGIKYGGAEVQLYLWSKYLLEQGYSVHVITQGAKKFTIEEYDGVVVHKSISSQRKYGVVSNIAAMIRLWHHMQLSGATTFIQRSIGPETGMIALYCKIMRKQFIYMIAHDREVDMKYRRQGDLLTKFAFWGMKQANAVITQSDDQHKQLQIMMPNISSTLIYSSYFVTKKLEGTKVSERDTILWVGRAAAVKQPEIFLRLAEQYPQYRYVMIMAETVDQELIAQVRKKVNLLDNVQYIPNVPFQDISQYFAQARVFINTSKSEGFPNTFVQAALHRCPIISLHVDPDTILQSHKMGWCAQGDENTLIDLLHRVMEKDVDVVTYVENAYMYALKNHSFARNGSVLTKLFDVKQ